MQVTNPSLHQNKEETKAFGTVEVTVAKGLALLVRMSCRILKVAAVAKRLTLLARTSFIMLRYRSSSHGTGFARLDYL